MNHRPTPSDNSFQMAASHACVHLQEPFPDCYCMDISSFNIPKMLAFCNRDYRSCPIFQREAKKATLSCARRELNGASPAELPITKE